MPSKGSTFLKYWISDSLIKLLCPLTSSYIWFIAKTARMTHRRDWANWAEWVSIDCYWGSGVPNMWVENGVGVFWELFKGWDGEDRWIRHYEEYLFMPFSLDYV